MKIRPAFVLTVVTACTPTPDPIVTANPPMPTTPEPTAGAVPSASSAPTATVATAPVSTAPVPSPDGKVVINPTDAEGRLIHRSYQGDSCFVYLPFPELKPGETRLPGTPPPSKPQPCPPALKDPAFETCRGGELSRKPDGSCECFEMGNPPRVAPNDCPSS